MWKNKLRNKSHLAGMKRPACHVPKALQVADEAGRNAGNKASLCHNSSFNVVELQSGVVTNHLPWRRRGRVKGTGWKERQKQQQKKTKLRGTNTKGPDWRRIWLWVSNHHKVEIVSSSGVERLDVFVLSKQRFKLNCWELFVEKPECWEGDVSFSNQARQNKTKDTLIHVEECGGDRYVPSATSSSTISL